MSSTSSTMFSGASRYAQDFQAAIDRSVAIASLPLSLLQDQRTALQNDSSALSSIDSKFSALQSAVMGITTALGSASYTATTSTEAATAAISDGVREGTYKITVTSFGSYAVATSVDDGTLQNVSNPATQNLTAYTTYQLKLGDNDPLTVTATNLNALVEAINSSPAGKNVTATLVNVGSADGSDRYALSMQGKRLEPLAITLTANPDIADAEHQPIPVLAQGEADLGATVKYKVGNAAEASSTSRSLELSPGLTVTLAKDNAGTTFDVNVTRGTASVRSALQSFVNVYNAVVDELDKHHGTNNGALSGQGIVASLAEPLRALTTWSAADGSLKSLRDIGIVIDSSGKLTFDATAFTKATKNGIGDVAAFLGSPTSGFLKLATDQLEAVEKSGTGILKSAMSINADAIKASTDHINAEQDRIDKLRTSLMEQMAKADALIASLEQQATYISSMFESMRVASEGYK